MNMEAGRSFEDQTQLLGQRAQADGDDWRVKIGRAESPSGRIEVLGTFDAVTVEQIANADTWIPLLFGGTGNSGIYYLYVTHAKDRAMGRTSAMLRLPALAGNPIPSNQIEWARIDQPSWPGPKALVSGTGGGAGGTGGGTSPVHPTTPGSPPSTARVFGMPQVQIPQDSNMASAFNAAQAALQAEREKLIETKRQAELDAIRREAQERDRRHEQHLSELREIMRSIGQGAAKPVNLAEVLTQSLTAVLPIISPILAARREEAQRREAEERRREEREEARAAEMQKRQDILLERVANQGAEVAKVMAAMSEASATMTRTMLQTMTSAIEMGLGQRPEEDNWGSIAKAFVSAFGEGMAARMSGPPVPSAPALPPRPASNGATPSAQPFAGRDAPARPAPSGNEVTLLESLVARIAARDPNVDGLATEIIFAIQNDEETQAALDEHGGDVIALLQSRLGATWANDPANLQYGQTLLGLLGQKGKAAGITAGEGEEADQ